MKMMSKIFTFFLVSVMLIACSTKENKQEQSEEQEWKALDDFHMTMAEVFHPLKDSGNTEPIFSRAEELAAEAEKFAMATIPSQINNDEVKAMLAKLKADTRALADEIKIGAAEDQAGTMLYAIHDHFHKIQKAWNTRNNKETENEEEDEEEEGEEEHEH